MGVMGNLYCRDAVIPSRWVPACLSALTSFYDDPEAGRLAAGERPATGFPDLVSALAVWEVPASWEGLDVRLEGSVEVRLSLDYEALFATLAPFLHGPAQIWIVNPDAILWRYVIADGQAHRQYGHLHWASEPAIKRQTTTALGWAIERLEAAVPTPGITLAVERLRTALALLEE